MKYRLIFSPAALGAVFATEKGRVDVGTSRAAEHVLAVCGLLPHYAVSGRGIPALTVQDFLSLEYLFATLSALLKYHAPELMGFLLAHNITPELYATSWVLTMLAQLVLAMLTEQQARLGDRVEILGLLAGGEHPRVLHLCARSFHHAQPSEALPSQSANSPAGHHQHLHRVPERTPGHLAIVRYHFLFI